VSRTVRRIRTTIAAAAAFSLYACGAPSAVPPPGQAFQSPTGLVGARKPKDAKIEHIIVVIQENRSVDNLFYGFPGADVQSYGYNKAGTKIPLQPIGLATTWDLGHSAAAFFTACNGTGSYPGTDCHMNGFDNEVIECGHKQFPACPNANPPYSYVPHSETAPYFTLGEQYVFADQMFASNFDLSSFISHQYIIAAQADGAFDFPNGWWGCKGGPPDTIETLTQGREPSGKRVQACFTYATLASELDAAGISWRDYSPNISANGGEWDGYQAIKDVYYGSDWKNDVVSPNTVFFSDVSNGTLPAVSWITPTCANSDHAGCNSDTGPSWVAQIVNAVGESQYWNSSVVFVFWDDAGGWYDHVPPTKVDYDGYGFRLPLLIISPYAKKKFVSHTLYEHGSILKFIEDRFGLARLSASDTRANSPENYCFDWGAPPRQFQAIPAKYSKDYILDQPADLRPPDNN